MNSILLWIAIGLGLGLSPVLPGTAGALLGVPLAIFLSRLNVLNQTIIVAILTGTAIAVCDIAETGLGVKDDPRIVADEYLTFPIATLALPCSKHPALLAMAFVTSRVFDGLKPPPAGNAERLSGGVGVVLDDVTSNLYALTVNAVVYFLIVFGRGSWRGNDQDDSANKPDDR